MKVGGARSTGPKSIMTVGSSRTRRTGVSRAMSRRTRNEIDFDDWEIEQIDNEIEWREKSIERCRKEIAQILKKSKTMTQNAKEQKTKGSQDEIETYRKQIMALYMFKESKTPSYEKLPKDHQYYKHYMQKVEYLRMKLGA